MARRRTRPRSTGGGLPEARERAHTIELLKAIAHPVRFLALLALNRQGPLSVGALQETCGIEQSAMSHQLQVLRRARLVSSRRDGKQVIYDLHDHHVAHIVEDALLHASERDTD